VPLIVAVEALSLLSHASSRLQSFGWWLGNNFAFATNDLLPDMVIVLWRINFKCIPSWKEHYCRHRCYSCLDAETRTE